MKKIYLFPVALLLALSFCNKNKDYDQPVPRTIPTIPVAPTTLGVFAVGQTTAQSGGMITSDGGDGITARGVCWSTAPNPTIADSKTEDGTGTGEFKSILTGLIINTTYYVRAYASNRVGTAYGFESRFKMILPSYVNPITDIDGNVYNTVTIGTQVWLKENLKTARYRNGDLIATGLNDAEWEVATAGAYAMYNNDPRNNDAYGKLYNWYAVADPRNIAPAGWHIPTEAEWNKLINYLGGWYSAAIKLQKASGFNALASGSRYSSGLFNGVGSMHTWWSSTETNTNRARVQSIYPNWNETGLLSQDKKVGYAIRCIKD